jgi:hypothetical protein
LNALHGDLEPLGNFLDEIIDLTSETAPKKAMAKPKPVSPTSATITRASVFEAPVLRETASAAALSPTAKRMEPKMTTERSANRQQAYANAAISKAMKTRLVKESRCNSGVEP